MQKGIKLLQKRDELERIIKDQGAEGRARQMSSSRANWEMALEMAALAQSLAAEKFFADLRAFATASQAPAATRARRPSSSRASQEMAYEMAALARSLAADLRASAAAS